MSYALGRTSEANLEGVDPRLARCARRVITTSSVDFQVFEGLRRLERQRELFRNGVSGTLDSYHLTGHALDLVPIIAGRLQWQAPACIQIAIAMREAAVVFEVDMVWGAVWDRPLRELDPWRLEREIERYIARWRAKNSEAWRRGKRPLIDYPHFQVSR